MGDSKPKSVVPPSGDEEPRVELEWSDEVGKLDQAIEEIRKINGGSDAEDVEELAFDPERIAVETEMELETPAISRSPFGSGPTVDAAWHIRPQSENEIAQLWSNTFLSVDHPVPKLVMVTAARRGDGATQIAFSLALAGADSADELQICLVDFNLRHPAIASMLGVKKVSGLSDVLTGAARLEDTIHTVRFKSGRKLSVLTAGAKADHPLSLLKSRQVKAIMTQLRNRFDHTIIDASCASSYPDAQILGSQVDGALLVVRAAETPRETVVEAKKRLDLSGSRCLGLVMNQRTDPIPALLYKMT